LRTRAIWVICSPVPWQAASITCEWFALSTISIFMIVCSCNVIRDC